MAVIEWDLLAERTYEVGIDRGVLAVPSLPLVPWNGLISVDESEIDAVQLRTYFDGRVYANFHLGGFFEAKIEGFGFPDELSDVLGINEIFPGLSITAQKRSDFNFSYRTMVKEEDYKIHLVYNATIVKSDRQMSTISDDLEAETFTWDISTMPPKPVQFRPTAHIVINSVHTDPDVLVEIEELLYGTEETDPEFPTQIQVVEIFES